MDRVEIAWALAKIAIAVQAIETARAATQTVDRAYTRFPTNLYRNLREAYRALTDEREVLIEELAKEPDR